MSPGIEVCGFRPGEPSSGQRIWSHMPTPSPLPARMAMVSGETKSQRWDRPSPMGAVELNHDVTLKSQPHPCVIDHRPLWNPDVLI